MLNINELKSILKKIDGRGCKAYKDIKNVYDEISVPVDWLLISSPDGL